MPAVPQEIAAWLACLAFVVMLINQAARAKAVLLGEKNEISPQPLEVREATKYVTKDHCDSLHQQADSRVIHLEAAMAEFRQERREETAELHNKVNSVSRDVASLKAVTDLQTQQLNRIDQKIERLIER